jgi:hypothetical protein
MQPLATCLVHLAQAVLNVHMSVKQQHFGPDKFNSNLRSVVLYLQVPIRVSEVCVALVAQNIKVRFSFC